MASAGGAVQVQNFVGKEVNGFEIIKLIGNHSSLLMDIRPRKVLIRIQGTEED